MFTGIIEKIGTVAGKVNTASGITIKIDAGGLSLKTNIGDSIAINGVCLSVVDKKEKILTFDVMHHTLKTTTLGRLKIGEHVNLEQSLKPGSRLGGHFVSGHIDYIGTIIDMMTHGSVGFKISVPDEYIRLVAEKGSIAVDGVSLTVARMEASSFIVYLIPYTITQTILGRKKKGDLVNVEIDLLSKYIARHIAQGEKVGLQSLLKKYDYL